MSDEAEVAPSRPSEPQDGGDPDSEGPARPEQRAPGAPGPHITHRGGGPRPGRLAFKHRSRALTKRRRAPEDAASQADEGSD